MMHQDAWLAHWKPQTEIGQEMAVVVPVYFSAKVPDTMVERLLRVTLLDCHHYLPLSQVWAVVDGDPRSAAILARLAGEIKAEHGETLHVIALPENLGKLGAIRVAMRTALQEQPHVRWLGVMDGDADHLASVLPQLGRAALFLEKVYGHGRVLVIGARPSRTRPMGWIRGELERLLDQLTLDALAYALAREGCALDLSQCLPGVTPDISSGFKIYGRALAEYLFEAHSPVFATLTPSDYWHYGPETVTFVETALAGGAWGEVLRPTWNGQPASSFGEFSVVTMYGELLTWVWARLNIPLVVAGQMMANRRGELALETTLEGREIVERFCAYALQRLADYRGERDLPQERPRLPFI